MLKFHPFIVEPTTEFLQHKKWIQALQVTFLSNFKVMMHFGVYSKYLVHIPLQLFWPLGPKNNFLTTPQKAVSPIGQENFHTFLLCKHDATIQKYSYKNYKSYQPVTTRLCVHTRMYLRTWTNFRLSISEINSSN